MVLKASEHPIFEYLETEVNGIVSFKDLFSLRDHLKYRILA